MPARLRCLQRRLFGAQALPAHVAVGRAAGRRARLLGRRGWHRAASGGFFGHPASAKPLITISISCATRIHISYERLKTVQGRHDRKNRAKFCHKALLRALRKLAALDCVSFGGNGDHTGSRTSPRARREPLLHATVDRDRRQHATTAILRRVDQRRTVRREARAFVLPALRQHLHGLATCRSTTAMR